MTVESVTYINTLDETRPAGGDKISEGDNHIRNIKRSLKETYPNVDGEVRASDEEMNFLVGLTEPIKDSLADGSQDITDIQGELAKKADTTYVDDQDALKADKKYVDEELAKKADITYVDDEVSEKADTTYVNDELAKKADKSDLSTLDNYEHWKLGIVGETGWKEVGSKEDVTFRPGYGVNIEFSPSQDLVMFSISPSLKDQIDNNEQGVSDNASDIATNAGGISDNASDIATLQNLVSDLQAQVGNLGGGMITATQQPATAGDFSVQGTDQTYRAIVAVGDNITKTLQVPAGKVFCLEYLYGINSGGGVLRVDIDQIHIDGVRMYPTNQGYFDYDQSGGSVWPGQDRGPLIRVQDKIEIKAMANYVSTSDLFLAGFFTEA